MEKKKVEFEEDKEVKKRKVYSRQCSHILEDGSIDRSMIPPDYAEYPDELLRELRSIGKKEYVSTSKTKNMILEAIASLEESQEEPHVNKILISIYKKYNEHVKRASFYHIMSYLKEENKVRCVDRGIYGLVNEDSE